MYKALSPGAIGVQANVLTEALEAAKIGGFQGIEVNPNEIADLIEKEGAEAVKSRFARTGVRPAGWSLPVDWRGGEENWETGLADLPRLAQACAAIDCRRTMEWIMPCSNEREYSENRRFHVERFTPIARILSDNGCSIGLEFIGPKTLRDTQKHPFVHTMEAMLDMGAEIGPNVGLLLDCFHWYTSHSTVDAVRALRPEQVVFVHVNDVPKGLEIDQQVDGTRGLPGETGVIDIAGFLQALQAIGYDGPVAPEPFKKELANLPSNEARLKTVGAAMTDIFRKAGLE